MTTPVQGRVSSPFGDRIHPVTKEKTFHNGVDISVKTGTAVKAPEAGTVTEIYVHETGGLSLILLADSGTRYGFAHLSQTEAKKGDKVSEGAVICYSGNSGKSTGPHLHFTVKKNDVWVNPQTLFNF